MPDTPPRPDRASYASTAYKLTQSQQSHKKTIYTLDCRKRRLLTSGFSASQRVQCCQNMLPVCGCCQNMLPASDGSAIRSSTFPWTQTFQQTDYLFSSFFLSFHLLSFSSFFSYFFCFSLLKKLFSFFGFSLLFFSFSLIKNFLFYKCSFLFSLSVVGCGLSSLVGWLLVGECLSHPQVGPSTKIGEGRPPNQKGEGRQSNLQGQGEDRPTKKGSGVPPTKKGGEEDRKQERK